MMNNYLHEQDVPLNDKMEEVTPSVATFSVFTLGCKVNQYETDRIRHGLSLRGFREVRVEDGPDICIVNTCMVTREAARKSRQLVRRYGSSASSRIYVTGCAVELAEESLSGLPDDIVLVPNSDKENLPDVIAGEFTRCSSGCVPLLSGRTRAYLKVQDGCDHFCSYCIIPHIRGRSRSRECEEILEELLELESMGYQEVVLTGIHLGDYGKHLKRAMNLTELVDYLLVHSKIPQIRLSSLEPMDFSFDLLDLFRDHRRLARHLHLPLQHGSDRILRAMNRSYTLEDYRLIVESAVSVIPDMAITTDLIIGFPGETDDDFEILYRYIEESPICMLHVFPFSCHPRTRAASLLNRVSGGIRRSRIERISKLGRLKRMEYLDRFIGSTLEVLVERKVEGGYAAGHTGNYIEVYLPGNDGLRGKLITTKITHRDGDLVYGENSEPVCAGR